jgi:hypothetical protein
MANITLNPEEQPAEEQTVAATTEQPVEQQPTQPEATPAEPQVPSSGEYYARLAGQAPEDEGVIKGLAPDPYAKESEKDIRGLFQYRPEMLGFTQEPKVRPEDVEAGFAKPEALDMVTVEQERLLAMSPTFFTLPDENGAIRELAFPEDASIEQKYRILLRNEGGYLPKYDENDQPVMIDGNPDLFELSTTREYSRYTTPFEPKNILEQAGEFMRSGYSAVMGETGRGDLGDMDEKLKKLGVTNQIARTLAMRGVATGKWDGDVVDRQLKDMGVFAMSLPKYGSELSSFLTTEVIYNSLETVTPASDGWNKYWTEEKEATKKGFQTITDFLDIAKHLDVEGVIQERSGEIYNPNVIEEVLAPRGLYQAVRAYGGPEAAMYGAWGTFRAVQAARRIPGLQKYMKDTYGSDDLVEAFAKARSGSNKNPNDIVRDYINTHTSTKVQRKLEKDLDLAFGMMVRQPGVARKELLQGEWNALNGRISDTMKLIKDARSTGKTAVVKRHQEVLKGLRKQKSQMMYGTLTPKYMRDLAGEAGLTAGSTAAFTQITQEFFGFKQSEQMPVEIGSALSVAIPFGRFGTSKDVAIRTYNSLGDMYRYVGDLWTAKGDKELRAELRAGNKAQRDAAKFFDELQKQPPQFQAMFIEGLQRHSELKNRLVELSAKSGIDIDENLMVTNLAQMSGIAELMDLSRQLDDKLTVTGLDDVAGAIVQRRELVESQQELITQMAVSTQKLLDLKLTNNLSDDDAVSVLADQMRNMVLSTQKRLNGDRQLISNIVETNREVIKSSMETAIIDPDKGTGAVQLLTETFTDQIDAIADDISADVRGLVLDPQNGVAQRLARLDELQQKNFEMLDGITRSIRPEEASNGRASLHFANMVAFRRSMIDSDVAKRYANFDTQNPNVHADIKGSFDYFMGSNVELDAGISEGVAKLAGYDMIASDKKGFALMFNGAAKRGISAMDKRTDGALSGVLEANELTERQPIQQWMELRRLAKEEPEKLGFDDPAQAMKFMEGLPLLVNTKEWRKVNKHLGKAMRKSTEDRQQKYMSLYDQWQNVGKSTFDDGTPNTGAFMEGWEEGVPRIVGDEIYGQFREIQDFYRQEVIERYAIDKQIKGWDATLQTKQKGAATGPVSPIKGGEQDALLDDFTKTFTQVGEEQMPVNWLNQALARVQKVSKDAGVTLSGDKLYNAIGSSLGKIGGVRNPKTGEYVLVLDSALPEDKIITEVGKNLQAIITRHMQGMLVKSFDNVMPRDAKGRMIFDPNVPIKYDEKTFSSMFNIPVYRRDEAGELVPMLTKDGSPVKLIDKEEVFSAVDLNALERNRIDLKDTFDEAVDYVNKMEDEILEGVTATGPRGEALGPEALVAEENKFIETFYTRLFGQRMREGDTILTKTQDINRNVYDMFVGRNAEQDIMRLKAGLLNEGYDPKYVEDFIAKSINNHIIDNVQRYTGSKQLYQADGVHVAAPQYEMSSSKILEMIGAPGSSTRSQLEQTIGQDAADTWGDIAEVIAKLDPPPSASGLDAHVSSMSMDSILSRIYNINRGVVSVQWVATESIIRAARQHSGALLRSMLKDKKVAEEVLKIVETGKVPQYKVEPKWLRVLMTEVVEAESRNESASEYFKPKYYDVTGFERPPEGPTNLEYAGIDEAVEPVEPKPQERAKTDVEKMFESLGLSTKQFQQPQQGAQ